MYKKWSELSYHEKHSRCNLVSAICSIGDIKKLKEIIPTVEELLAYRDMNNGGSVLHTLMYSRENKSRNISQLEFLQQIFKEYGLDQNEELRKQLLLKRNSRGKYAADYMYVLQYCSNQTKQSVAQFLEQQYESKPDTRTDFEKNKVHIYNFLREEILKVRYPAQKSDAHKIGDDYSTSAEYSSEKSGTPTTHGLFLPDKDGNPALFIRDSVKEVYPEIRLRNIKENGEDDVIVIKNLDPQSSKSLAEQVFENLDFPDEFEHHFAALREYEKDYKNMRSDPNQFAYMRNFVQQRGAIIFEDTKDPTHIGNSNSGNDYGGYAGKATDKDTSTNFPVIVLRSDYYGKYHDRTYSTLLHELYHKVDLRTRDPLSELDITKYTFMLAEQSPDNPIKTAFDTVNSAYPPNEYETEITAQVMSVKNKSLLSASPLLKQFHNLGEMFAMAQTDNCPALTERIRNACITLPKEELEQLQIMYREFMTAKEEQFKREDEIRKAYSGAEAGSKIWQSRQEFNKTMAQQNQANEPQRKALEAKLSRCILSATRHAQHLLDNPQLGKIVMPPIAYKVTATSARPIEEAIAPYYEKQPNIETLEHCTRRLSSFKNLQKSEEISPFYASELIKVAYISEQLYKQKYKGSLPDELPSFSKMTEETFRRDPNTMINSINLFTEAIKSNASEVQLRASLFCNKPIASLTNEDYLLFNIHDFNNKKYLNKSTSTRPRDEILSEISKGLKVAFEKAGYKKEEMPDFFAIAEENGTMTNINLCKNLKEAVGYIKQGYSSKVLNEIFTIAATYKKNDMHTQVQTYLDSVPESDKYKKMTITNNRTNLSK